MASFHSYFSLLLILSLSLSELDVSLARRSLYQSGGSSPIGSLTSTGSATPTATGTQNAGSKTTSSASPTKTTSSASPTGLSGSTSPSKPKSSSTSSGLSGLGGLSKPADSSSHASGLSGSTGSGLDLSGSTSPAISTPTPTTPKPGFPFPMPDLRKIIPDIVALNKDLVAIIRAIRSGNTEELPQIVKNLIPHYKKLIGDLLKPKPPTTTAAVQPQIVF